MRRIFVPLAIAALACQPASAQPQAGIAATPPADQPPTTPLTTPPTTPVAQPTKGLSLDGALQAALSRNAQMRAAALGVEASSGALQQAGLLPNPVLDVEQEDTRPETRSTTVLLSQTVELGGKRAARIGLGQLNRDLAAAELAARQADIRASTIEAFFGVLIAQEKLKVAVESTKLASSGAEAVSRRVMAGKVSPTEETRSKVAEATARIELSRARSEQAMALRALAAVVGAPQGSISQVDGDPATMPSLPTGAELTDRLQQAPALRRARLEVERAEAAYRLERARATPDVTVGVGAKRMQEQGRTAPMFSVSIPLPVFDRNQGSQLEALRRRDAAQAQAEADESRLQSEVLQSIDQLEARREELALLRRDVLPGAEIAHQAARRGFELGKFGFLDVLDAQRTLLQARDQYFAALAVAHRLAADIERRLGAPPNERR
ncbi:MAG: TolC family protein [Rubrivivax sp.]|nr:MAG: TolC family protein [Rubrivivax sp.]